MEAKGQIIDDTPIYYKDKEARDLLGEEELETEAQTCTGAINELKQSLNESVLVKKGTLTSTIGRQLVVSDSTLVGNYIIIGYTVNMGGTWYQWYQDTTIDSIDINSAGISVSVKTNVLANQEIYIMLHKIT